MIIPVKPVPVRLSIMCSSVSSVQNNIHQFDIDKLYEERNSNSYELVWFISGNPTEPMYSKDYVFGMSAGKPTNILFWIYDKFGNPYYVNIQKGGSVLVSTQPMPGNWQNQIASSIETVTIPSYINASGLSANTYTVGYSSDRLCVEFYDEGTASFLFSVWAVGDTTGNAEQVFCTKVPSKDFLAKSTPSLFTVTKDSSNSNLYYIACKTSGYTTTLNVTKIIDTSGGSVSLYMEA